MSILEFDSSLYERAMQSNNENELKAIVAELAEQFIIWQKVLNDALSNLDSSNVKYLDFSVTKVTNADTVI